MKIDTTFLNTLSEQAKVSPRLRQNYDLRTSDADTSQRMLNALQPGTVVPIHRHKGSTETVILIRGCVREVIFDDNGKEIEGIILNSETPMLQIPAGQWHTLEVIDPDSIIFEAKDGAYQPLEASDIMQ
ncbi:MAG: cupin fold metalloprotein, WbuC family [Bacteroidales bacterium]|nr:cupin fold metalloprotein, WbuC family [Bacteroidales bacterium]